MFSRILVPVDLSHLDRLEKALNVAAREAQSHDASVIYMGVTEEAPGAVARNPKEYARKLEAFVADQVDAHGVTAEALCVVSNDPATEINKLILKSAQDAGADLVVMAGHSPRMLDWIMPSHGGWVAEHSTISVFVVR